jgi:hypothetical protein
MKKQYAIKGTGCPEYGNNIIKFFEQLGAVNENKLECYSPNPFYYFIEKNNEIKALHDIPPNHTEIELLPNGMAKGVWYRLNEGVDYYYIKPKKYEINSVLGEVIELSMYKNNDIWDDDDVMKHSTPLTDLTEIQPYLPDGHEDKDRVNIQVEYSPDPNSFVTITNEAVTIYGAKTIKEAIERLQKLIS